MIKGFFSKITAFFKEVCLEVRKINWPSKQETLRYTLIVIGASVVVAVFLGAVDFVFTSLLNKFIL